MVTTPESQAFLDKWFILFADNEFENITEKTFRDFTSDVAQLRDQGQYRQLLLKGKGNSAEALVAASEVQPGLLYAIKGTPDPADPAGLAGTWNAKGKEQVVYVIGLAPNFFACIGCLLDVTSSATTPVQVDVLAGTHQPLGASVIARNISLLDAQQLQVNVAPDPRVVSNVLYAVESTKWNGKDGATVYVHGLTATSFASTGWVLVNGEPQAVEVDVAANTWYSIKTVWRYLGDAADNNISAGAQNGCIYDSDHGDNTYFSSHHRNAYATDHSSNVYGAHHLDNTYDFSHGANRYEANHLYNFYGAYHGSNTYGAGHSENEYSSEHSENTYGASHSRNKYGSQHRNNSYGAGHSNNSYGDDCQGLQVGPNCTYLQVGSSCRRVVINNCNGTPAQPFIIPRGTVDVEYRNNQLVVAGGGASGTVTSVNGQGPNAAGNVQLVDVQRLVVPLPAGGTTTSVLNIAVPSLAGTYRAESYTGVDTGSVRVNGVLFNLASDTFTVVLSDTVTLLAKTAASVSGYITFIKN